MNINSKYRGKTVLIKDGSVVKKIKDVNLEGEGVFIIKVPEESKEVVAYSVNKVDVGVNIKDEKPLHHKQPWVSLNKYSAYKSLFSKKKIGR